MTSPPRAAPDDRYGVAAADRALLLLDALAQAGPATLARLAELAGCTRTGAFRLLHTLRGRGFAMQDGARGKWRLGVACETLGRAAAAQGALSAAAAAHLAALSLATGETSYLSVRNGLEATTVAVHPGTHPGRRYREVGARQPLHAGPGRVLLAFAPEPLQAQALAQRLARFTAATRADPRWIDADLRRIRQRGWLVTTGEVTPGAVSLAAPVRDATGAVVAVLWLAAPGTRLRRPQGLLPALLDEAVRLSATLGAG